MNELLNVVIVMSRCSSTKQAFGIRFEEKSQGRWIADWAFVIKEASAKKEGYDRSEIRGTFGFDRAYPGCPHCHSVSIFKCGCDKVACCDTEQRAVTCPWCGSTGELSGQVEKLHAGGDY